jgi:non-lysosomal glucosylceramidase
LPLGGIGTGTVSINGRGSLVDWEIMNRPAKGFSTVTKGNDAPFFSIHVEGYGYNETKGLMGPLIDEEYEHMEGRSVDYHGVPRFEKASFDATYPFGIVNLSDSNLPVDVKIKAFNPLQK